MSVASLQQRMPHQCWYDRPQPRLEKGVVTFYINQAMPGSAEPALDDTLQFRCCSGSSKSSFKPALAKEHAQVVEEGMVEGSQEQFEANVEGASELDGRAHEVQAV